MEIRNRTWLDPRLTDLLRKYKVAPALTDTSFMPRPWEHKQKFDLITTDFTYVRWLGNRKGIEELTRTWDGIILDREDDSGNGPGTINLFWKLLTESKA